MTRKFLTPVDFGGNQINNLGTPVSATDAATKGYVDSVAQGLNVKLSVVAATTGVNLPVLSGLLTIDGVTLVAGNRVLVKDQTTPAQNGIYIASAGAWTRANDDAIPAIGDFVFIEQGTINAKQGWILATNSTTWVQFTAAGQYIAGGGITITGNTIAASLQKFSTTIPGSSTSVTINHNLNTLDVVVALYATADGSEVIADILRINANSIVINFAQAPTANAYRVVVIG